jgi:hypothetical protein
MVQPSTSPNIFSADFDHHVLVCPTRSAAHVPTEPQARSAGRPAVGPQDRVTWRAKGRVVVLEVAAPLGDVVDNLDRAIELALAERPRGVVCDLSAVPEGAEPGAIGLLARAGRHVRDWPGIPVAVACPDPRVRAALSAHPQGRHLIVTESMLPAVSAVLATPIPEVECRRLTPHPTAPRASRNLIARALLDWGLGPLVPAASLVMSELVTNSTIHAGTDIELSVEWSLGVLRLTVRDKSPDLPRRLYPQSADVHGRGLGVVAALSRAFGVLPTADGGKAVWAVLNAARPHPATSNGMPNPKPAHETQLGPEHPQTPRELSTYSRTSPTARDGSNQSIPVTDQR